MTNLSWIQKKVILRKLYSQVRSLRAKNRAQLRKQLLLTMEHASMSDGVEHQVAAHHQCGILMGMCSPVRR